LFRVQNRGMYYSKQNKESKEKIMQEKMNEIKSKNYA
jgi:hypothetical protein